MKEAEPTVLVVDDDDSFCRGVERLLRSVGLKAATFVSAQEFMHHPHPSMVLKSYQHTSKAQLCPAPQGATVCLMGMILSIPIRPMCRL